MSFIDDFLSKDNLGADVAYEKLDESKVEALMHPRRAVEFANIFVKQYQSELFTDQLYFDTKIDDKFSNIDVIKKQLTDNNKRIPQLCDKLVRLGHLEPILTLAKGIYMLRYKEIQYGSVEVNEYGVAYFTKFLDLLKKYSDTRINNYGLDYYCNKYIEFILITAQEDHFYKHNAETFSREYYKYSTLNTANILPARFICSEILGIDEGWELSPDKNYVELPEKDRGVVPDAETLSYCKKISLDDIERIIQKIDEINYKLSDETNRKLDEEIRKLDEEIKQLEDKKEKYNDQLTDEQIEQIDLEIMELGFKISDHKINQVLEKNFYKKDKFARASWIIDSILLYIDRGAKVYLSKEYILPAFKATHLRDDLDIKQRVIYKWCDEITFTFLINSYSPKIKAEIEAMENNCTEEEFSDFVKKYFCSMCYDIQTNLMDMSFEDAIPIPCKGFGVVLKDFFDNDFDYVRKAKTIEGREIRLDEYRAKEELLAYLSTDSKLSRLKRLCVLSLFGDGMVDEALDIITHNPNLYIDDSLKEHSNTSDLKQFSLNEKVAFFKAFYSDEFLDFSKKTALCNIIKEQIINSQTTVFSQETYPEDLIEKIDKELDSYVLKSLKPLIYDINKTIIELQKANEEYLLILSKSDSDGDESQIAELVSQIQKCLARIDRYMKAIDGKNSKFNICPSSEYDELINKSVQEFYTEVKKADAEKDIFGVLKPEHIDIVRSYLRQGELIMDLQKELRDIKWQETLDYSAPILYITKPLEYIGNLLFSKLIDDVDADTLYDNLSNANEKNNLKKFYMKTSRRGNITGWVDFITLGSVAHIYDNSVFRRGDIDILKLIDKDKLESLDGKIAYVDENGVKHPFTDDVDANLNTLSKAILFATNYRNSSAHKDKVDLNKYEECKELMITAKHLLWITLYIIKDKDSNGKQILLGY